MQQAQKSRVELPDKTNKQTNKQNQNIVLNLNFRDNFFFFPLKNVLGGVPVVAPGKRF